MVIREIRCSEYDESVKVDIGNDGRGGIVLRMLQERLGRRTRDRARGLLLAHNPRARQHRARFPRRA